MYASPSFFRLTRVRRSLVFGVIIIIALLAFEIFNYSTTEHALSDLLGDLDFASIRWATILAIAFCGIDFAGIARLFAPNKNPNGNPAAENESWYLFGAWFLAATMNAMLTWWGVSLAVLGHDTLGNEVVSRATMLRVVPIFVAVLVWLIRVLIIGTFSVAGDRLFDQDQVPAVDTMVQSEIRPRTFERGAIAAKPALRPLNSSSVIRSSNRTVPISQAEMHAGSRPEPTYHSTMAAGPHPSGSAIPNAAGTRPGAPRSGPQPRR